MGNIQGLNDEFGYARVLLCDMTDDQLATVMTYLAHRGPRVISEMRALRAQAFGPPVKGLLQLSRSVGNERLWYFAANWVPVMFSDWLSSTMTIDRYENLLMFGAGFEREMAERAAQDIITPDTGGQRLADSVETKLRDLPFVGDSAETRWLADLATNVLAWGASKVASMQAGKDNLWEAMSAGELIHKEKQRMDTVAASGAWNTLLHRFRTPGATGATGAPVDAGALGVTTNVPPVPASEMNDPHRIPYIQALSKRAFGAETGDPTASLADKQRNQLEARAELLTMMEDMRRLRYNPLHQVAELDPETGGLFSSIGRAFRSVAKTVAPLVKIAAPIAGMAIGGPIGGMITSKVAGAIMPGSKPRSTGGSPLAQLADVTGGREPTYAQLQYAAKIMARKYLATS